VKPAQDQIDVLVDDLEKNLIQKVLEINPDIIAFSVVPLINENYVDAKKLEHS
jgi:hypothetical protein